MVTEDCNAHTYFITILCFIDSVTTGLSIQRKLWVSHAHPPDSKEFHYHMDEDNCSTWNPDMCCIINLIPIILFYCDCDIDLCQAPLWFHSSDWFGPTYGILISTWAKLEVMWLFCLSNNCDINGSSTQMMLHSCLGRSHRHHSDISLCPLLRIHN